MVTASLDPAVSEFGAAVTAKFATGTGEPEDQLRGPVEELVRAVGDIHGIGEVVLAGEDQLSDLRVRPDFAVFVDDALVGHLEVKAPGKGADPRAFSGAHDRRQWERLQSLPNLLYTDGNQWALYQGGQRAGGLVRLDGDVTTAGEDLAGGARLGGLLSGFLTWDPVPPRTPEQLAVTTARLCRLVRAEVFELMDSAPGLQELAADWRDLLFPEATDASFANQYAQTVTFALLLARVEDIALDEGNLPEVARQLGDRHSLIGTALKILTDEQLLERLATSVHTLVRVLSVVDWEQITEGNEDLWLLFYEDFLQEYDPELRRASGSYYTPHPVVDAMVGLTDQLVSSRLERPTGLADSGVTMVDPAAGTGTFLFRIVERIATTVADRDGEAAVPGALTAATGRLVGFESQTGPFAVSELRLAEELRRHGAAVPSGELRLHVADTLDDPFVEEVHLGGLYEPIARSRRDANHVKAKEDVLVVIGNPPYREKSKGEGGWIEAGNPDAQQPAPLEDFIPPASWGLGPHVKHLYNPYVYFWRWATWKVFDAGPHNRASTSGVVAFITVAGFLQGPGFAKMRDYLRRTADAVWVIDCSPEGHQPPVSSRVFEAVQQPICITIALRDGSTDSDTPAPVVFRSLQPGPREQKFTELADIAIDDGWRPCPGDWQAPLLPAGGADWRAMPRLEQLVPWHGSGTMPGRTWVVAPDAEVLKDRWQQLVDASGDRQRELLKEHSDRTIDKVLSDNLYGYPATDTPLSAEDGPCPDPVKVGYRSFDRQWIIPDKRLINRPNPSLWYVRSRQQLYLTAWNRKIPQNGPAVTFTSLVPDHDHYRGSFGGRAFPLWRDPDGGHPNVTPGLRELLATRYGRELTAVDVFAYLAAVMATSAYTNRFLHELETPGLRVPVTADGDLFNRAVELGREVLWLHSYGERCVDPSAGRPAGPPRAPEERRPRLVEPIPQDEAGMPRRLNYEPDSQRLHVGAGVVAPVSADVWHYQVSGTPVVTHWFNYRKHDPAGGHESPLDDVVVESWPAHYTTELLDLLNVLTLLIDLEPAQAELLDEITAGTLIDVNELTSADVLPVEPTGSKRKPSVPDDGPQTTIEL